MAEPPALPNLFEVNFTFLRISLRGTAANVAAAATIGTGLAVTGYWGWKIPNSRRFMKIFQDVIVKRGAKLAGVSKGCLVLSVIAEDDEVAQKIEEDCASGEILKEINAQLTEYNEKNEEDIGNFNEIQVIDKEKRTTNADRWNKLIQDLEKVVENCIKNGLKTLQDQIKQEKSILSININIAPDMHKELHFHQHQSSNDEKITKLQNTVESQRQFMEEKFEQLLTQQYKPLGSGINREEKQKAELELEKLLKEQHSPKQPQSKEEKKKSATSEEVHGKADDQVEIQNLRKHIKLLESRLEAKKVESQLTNVFDSELNTFVSQSALEKSSETPQTNEVRPIMFTTKTYNLQEYPKAEKELQILQNVVDSKYLMRYVDHKCEDWILHITTENFDTDVEQYMAAQTVDKDKFNLSPMDIVRNMIEGMYELHCNYGIAHRDIKPQYFVLKKTGGLDKNYIVKVCGFGLSRMIDENRSTIVGGADGYMAPEYRKLLETKDGKVLISSQALCADVFSLGLVLYYVLTNGKHPFGVGPTTQNFHILYNMGLNLQHLFAEKGQLTDEEKINACGLIYWMLSHEPEDRPTMEEVKCHPFLWNYEEKVEFLKVIANYVKGIWHNKDDGSQSGQKSSTSKSNSNWVFEPESTPLTQKVEKLETYPAWMSKDFWMNHGSNPDKEMKFNSTFNLLKKMHKKMPTGQEPTDSSQCVQQLLVTMRKKIVHAAEYHEDALALGLGVKKDWDLFYHFYTKNNPQILLRAYQLFWNSPIAEGFRKKMLSQDRGSTWKKIR